MSRITKSISYGIGLLLITSCLAGCGDSKFDEVDYTGSIVLPESESSLPESVPVESGISSASSAESATSTTTSTESTTSTTTSNESGTSVTSSVATSVSGSVQNPEDTTHKPDSSSVKSSSSKSSKSSSSTPKQVTPSSVSGNNGSSQSHPEGWSPFDDMPFFSHGGGGKTNTGTVDTSISETGITGEGFFH